MIITSIRKTISILLTAAILAPCVSCVPGTHGTLCTLYDVYGAQIESLPEEIVTEDAVALPDAAAAPDIDADKSDIQADAADTAGRTPDGWADDGLKAPYVDTARLKDGYTVMDAYGSVGAYIPSAYSSLEEGYVSAVRDQGDSDLCWSFATNAAMEINGVKKGFWDSDTQLSPDATGYYFYNRVADRLNLTNAVSVKRSRAGKSSYYDNGGNIFNTVFELMQWLTPIAETEAPFLSKESSYPDDTGFAYDRDMAHAEQVLWTASCATDAIKQLVYEYGAAAVSVYLSSSGVKTLSQNGIAGMQTLYNDSQELCNHAVTIIGWDDDFPKEYFIGAQNKGITPDTDGAFICKNSYEESGIFYLSYSDASLVSTSYNNKAVAYDMGRADNFTNNYGYDGGVGTNRAGRTGELYAASIFEAAANPGADKAESLGAVAFATNTAGVSYEISVYAGVDVTGGDPTGGILQKTVESEAPLAYPGYYLVRFDEPVYLDEGDTFSVVVKLSAENINDNVNIMYDDIYGGSAGFVSSNPNASEGRSYLSRNGEEWSDTAVDNLNAFLDKESGHVPTRGYVRIKAFTDNTAAEGLRVIDSDMVSLIPDQVYTGEQIAPDPQIYYGTKRLTKDKDYVVTYGANKVVGKGTGTLTINAKGRYTSRTPIVRSFNIKKRTMTDPGIIVSGLDGQVYTGGAITPVTVSFNSIELKSGHDYTIKYRRNNRVGMVTATLRGKGNFIGTRRVSFEVAKRDIADENIIVKDIKPQEYKGALLYPQLTVLNGYNHKEQLKEKVDYTIEYRDNLMPGEASVLILGQGNYCGNRTVHFTINGADLSKVNVSKINDATYTGEAITPEVEVFYGANKLTESVDYEISYTDNINVGTATVSIAGRKGTIYAGTGITKTFNINAASIANATIENFGDVAYKAGTRYYTQNEKTKDAGRVKVRLPGGYYLEPSEYEISYENNYSTGSTVTAKMIITATGENVTGTISRDFNIVMGKDVLLSDRTDSRLTVTGFPSAREYILDNSDHRDGADNSVKPAIVVSYKGTVLEKDKDYTVSYHNNTAIGTAYLTIEGVNGSGYTGSRTEYYDIIGKPIYVTALGVADNDFYSDGPKDCVYDGSPKTPEIIIYERILKNKDKKTKKRTGVKRLVEGRDYTLKYTRNVDAGVATVVLNGIGEYSGKHTFNFNIESADLSKMKKVKLRPVTYTGDQIHPNLYLKNAGGYLREGVDYQVTYGENINAGIGTVIYTAVDLSPEDIKAGHLPNYVGQLTVPFRINPRSLKDGAVTVSGLDGVEYRGTRVEPDISLILNTGFGDRVVPESEYSVKYGNNAAAGSGGLRVRARGVNDGGTGNFKGSVAVSFKVGGSFGLTPGQASGNSVVYTRKKAVLSIPMLETSRGTFMQGTDYRIKTDKRIDVGEGSYTIVGKGAMKGINAYGSYEITPMTLDGAMLQIKNVKDGRFTSATNPVKQSRMKIKVPGGRLIKGRDYVLTYFNTDKAGAATVVIAFVNNYSGSTTVQYNIY